LSRIKELRKQKGVSVEKLAESLGISVPYLYDIEKERRRLHEDLIKKLCDYFNISADYLLSRNGNHNSNGFKYPLIDFLGSTVKIPIIGIIRAGDPLFADQNIIGYEDVPASEVKDGEYFYLIVTGDSMTGSGIYPGYKVLVLRQEYAENGQIAVVLVKNEEATLKWVKYIDQKISLLSDNPKYEPMIYKPEEVQILGIVKKVEFVPTRRR